MGLFNYGSLPSWILNPVGNLIELLNTSSQKNNPNSHYNTGEPVISGEDVQSTAELLWDDVTGKSAIELQNKLDREMAEEEYQRNLQAIGDTAAAYEAAGFNRNLLYSGASPGSYSAPSLQAYSGTQKLDRIIQKTGQVLGMIPAMYQATAALEGIDQARERTKQSEIKTMSMGMSLLDQGYKLGDLRLSRPFTPNIEPFRWSTKRHVKPIDFSNIGLSIEGYDRDVFNRYADAALKNKFDLLRSIGIKNDMNSTLNNWRGYQYELDRRFGAAGRIIGMASQGVRSIGSLFSPIKLGGYK